MSWLDESLNLLYKRVAILCIGTLNLIKFTPHNGFTPHNILLGGWQKRYVVCKDEYEPYIFTTNVHGSEVLCLPPVLLEGCVILVDEVNWILLDCSMEP